MLRTIAVDDPATPDISALLATHLEFAKEHSPPEHVHALDIEGLRRPNVTFFSLREGGRLLGVGALKELDPQHGEIKSMHTASLARGTGVGRAMLDYLIGEARRRGYRRLSLETGTMDAFAPARALYESAGFIQGEPFGDYWDNAYSVCMSLSLADA